MAVRGRVEAIDQRPLLARKARPVANNRIFGGESGGWSSLKLSAVNVYQNILGPGKLVPEVHYHI